MFNGKMVRARNVSLRSPRRERHIVRCRDKREVKTDMSRKEIKKRRKFSVMNDLAKYSTHMRGSITFVFRKKLQYSQFLKNHFALWIYPVPMT